MKVLTSEVSAEQDKAHNTFIIPSGRWLAM